MPNDQNLVILQGNLAADPTYRDLEDGRFIAEASLAVNESWTDPTGQVRERVSFIGLVAYSQLGRNLALQRKGQRLFLQGRLMQEDRPAGTRANPDRVESKTKVRLLLLQPLSPPRQGEPATPSASTP